MKALINFREGGNRRWPIAAWLVSDDYMFVYLCWGPLRFSADTSRSGVLLERKDRRMNSTRQEMGERWRRWRRKGSESVRRLMDIRAPEKPKCPMCRAGCYQIQGEIGVTRVVDTICSNCSWHSGWRVKI